VKHFLVIGLGRCGRAVAEGLTEVGYEVVAVDMALVEAVHDRVAVAAQVDSVEAEALRAVNATEADAAVVAIGEDFAAGALTVAVLKELGIARIVARANNDRERRILGLVGATGVLSVEVEMGQRLARSLVATDVVDTVALGGDVSVVYWTARVLDRTLADTDLVGCCQLHPAGVRAAGSERSTIPIPADHVFREGDVLLRVGADARLGGFTR
jgi:trk system potassium uptake protein TrkA